jgi:hypothetical protein
MVLLQEPLTVNLCGTVSLEGFANARVDDGAPAPASVPAAGEGWAPTVGISAVGASSFAASPPASGAVAGGSVGGADDGKVDCEELGSGLAAVELHNAGTPSRALRQVADSLAVAALMAAVAHSPR